MKKIFLLTIMLLLFQYAYSQINVVASYPYIRDIAVQIGGDKINSAALARGDYNPHMIIPKPSYIAKLRRADLLIINGAQLEIGWLPPILRQSNNSDIQPGEKGFLDLSTCVNLADIPISVSRGQGDIHPEGNPHFHLDPDNIPLIADAICKKLCEIDAENESFYKNNRTEFKILWQKKNKEWEEKMRPSKGMKVIEYHKIFDYFLHRYGIIIAQTIEPLPGIPPTSKHIGEVEKLIKRENIRCILQDVYNPKDASEYISKKTGIKMIILPNDVESIKGIDEITALFDEIVRSIIQ